MSIQEVVEAIKQKDQADAESGLVRAKTVLGLPELDAKAEERITYIASRATELDNIFKATTVAPSDRQVILAKRPGLALWFTRVDEAQDRLRGITFGVQSILTLARDRYARLVPEDCTPRPDKREVWLRTGKGEFNSTIWHLHESLANNALPPAGDIDTAITILQTAFKELSERLESVA